MTTSNHIKSTLGLAAIAAVLAVAPGAAQAMDNMIERSVRTARRSSKKGLGRTVHGLYDGNAKNQAANTKRGLKKALGARQLKKMQRQARKVGV